MRTAEDYIPLEEEDGRDRPFAPVAENDTVSHLPKVALPSVIASSLAGQPIPERSWHVEALIPAGTVTMLGGDGGVGKSLLALQLAAATAIDDVYWIGREPRRGRCLFVTAEDDIGEVHRRLVDVAADLDRRLDAFDQLEITSLAGEDALLAVTDGKGNVLKPTALYFALEAKIKASRPVLVVLDTLADLFGGEENQRAQARQFVSLLRGLAIHHGTTVLLLAHPSLAGMASGSGSSGSTAWNNSVRSRLYLERIKGDDGGEDDPDARVLRTMKSNYGRTGDEIRCRWHRGVFSIRGQATDGFAKVASETKAERIFIEVLAAFEAEGRNVSATPSANYAPAIFARDPRSESVNKSSLTKAMGRLFAAKRIQVLECGSPSKRRQRIAIVKNADVDTS